MPTVAEVCQHVRSKNAGPFWITIDLFFSDRARFDAYSESPALQSVAIARLFRVEKCHVKRHAVPKLAVLKISYPRQVPQGGVLERDMHGGQQFVPLLDVQL